MSDTIVTISNHIYQCRRMAIILDEDLALLYQTETKQINRAVQRNKGRFPGDFAFQLTKEEWDSLRCQNGTSKSGSGGRRYLPFAFTEQGVAMLSAVLRTEVALKVSIIIIRAFVNFKKQNFQFIQMQERVEKIERNQPIGRNFSWTACGKFRFARNDKRFPHAVTQSEFPFFLASAVRRNSYSVCGSLFKKLSSPDREAGGEILPALFLFLANSAKQLKQKFLLI